MAQLRTPTLLYSPLLTDSVFCVSVTNSWERESDCANNWPRGAQSLFHQLCRSAGAPGTVFCPLRLCILSACSERERNQEGQTGSVSVSTNFLFSSHCCTCCILVICSVLLLLLTFSVVPLGSKEILSLASLRTPLNSGILRVNPLKVVITINPQAGA